MFNVLLSKNMESLACRFSCVSLLTITIIASLPRRVREVPFCWYVPRYQVDPVAPRRAAKKVLGAASGTRGHIWPSLVSSRLCRPCVTSDPYAAGFTFARSAFTGDHPGPKGRTYDIIIYNYIQTAKSLS